MRRATWILVGLIVGASTATLGTNSAFASPAECEREISKSFAKFTQAKMKAAGRCRDGVLAGKTAGPCPDAATTSAVAKAETRMRASIAGEGSMLRKLICSGICIVPSFSIRTRWTLAWAKSVNVH